LKLDEQDLCDHSVQFVRWQHPAMGEVCCTWHHLIYVYFKSVDEITGYIVLKLVTIKQKQTDGGGTDRQCRCTKPIDGGAALELYCISPIVGLV